MLLLWAGCVCLLVALFFLRLFRVMFLFLFVLFVLPLAAADEDSPAAAAAAVPVRGNWPNFFWYLGWKNPFFF